MRSRPNAAPLVAMAAAALLAAGCGDDASSDAPQQRSAAEEQSGSADAPEQGADGEDGGLDGRGSSRVSFTITLEGGLVDGGVRQLKVSRGTQVLLKINSDTRDEVHLHGIDVETQVGPGMQGTLEFEATDQGSYELEAHDSGAVLGTVVVS